MFFGQQQRLRDKTEVTNLLPLDETIPSDLKCDRVLFYTTFDKCNPTFVIIVGDE